MELLDPGALAAGPAQLMPASAWGRHCVFAFDATLFLDLHVLWRCSCYGPAAFPLIGLTGECAGAPQSFNEKSDGELPARRPAAWRCALRLLSWASRALWKS